jgi:GTPase Era involved in 16S rRNA processing
MDMIIRTVTLSFLQDAVSDTPERFFVAEIVREKIFQQYRQEIPYCSSVSPTHKKCSALDTKSSAMESRLIISLTWSET